MTGSTLSRADSPTPALRRPGLVARLLAGALVVGTLLGLWVGPRARLSDAAGGDAALARDARAAAGDGAGLQTLSAARIEHGATTFAGLGDLASGTPTQNSAYELGSITKTFTGMLLADAVRRGEMRLDAPLSTYLPELAGTPAGTVTPQQLATHTSGLPRMPIDGALSGAFAVLRGADPYRGKTEADLLTAAKSAQLTSPGTFAYSNFGMALLGHAEARAAHAAAWSELATERLLRPLHMDSTRFVDGDDAQDAELAAPHTANGRATSAWAATAYDPAGVSTRTTAADMARFAAAVLDGSAPGLDALTPRVDAGEGDRVGLAWLTHSGPAGTYLWHNGGTGGSRSVVAIDRSAGTAAVVLGNSATSVDEIGPALIHRGPATPATPVGWATWLPLLVAALLVGSAWWKAWRGASRLSLVGAIADAGSGAIVAWLFGPWDVLPGWLFGAIVAAALTGAAYAALRLRTAPTWPRHHIRAAFDLAVSVLLFAILAVLL